MTDQQLFVSWVHGLFPDCLWAESDAKVMQDGVVKVTITLFFAYEFDIEDRADQIRELCTRLKNRLRARALTRGLIKPSDGLPVEVFIRFSLNNAA